MLSGSRVLVVEDEPTTALFIADVVARAEGEVVGPFSTLREARSFILAGHTADAAILDVNLADGEVTPLLEALRARGTPVIMYTGNTALPRRISDRHPDLTVLHKPVQPGRLVGELRRHMNGMGDSGGHRPSRPEAP